MVVQSICSLFIKVGNTSTSELVAISTMDKADADYLKKIYTDPKHRTAFTSAAKLWKYIKLHGKDITRKQLKNWLSEQDVYTSHHPIVRKFPTRKVVTHGINDVWDVDLMDVSNLAEHNDGVRFIAIFIDIFSRYLYAEPMTDKSAPTTLTAIKNVFRRSGQQPETFRSDAGQEFLGKVVQEYLADREIYQQVTRNEKKANYAERVIQTLKKKIYRYLYYKITERYIDVLQDLVAGYNDNYHSSIKCAPSAVTAENEVELWAEQYIPEPTDYPKKLNINFKAGDLVRISNARHPFSKGYGQTYSEELFRIDVVHPTNPPTYVLKDLNGKVIAGLFYEREMVIVRSKDPATYERIYRVEKVLKERMKRGKKEYFIKWKGYGSNFNSWEPEKNLL